MLLFQKKIGEVGEIRDQLHTRNAALREETAGLQCKVVKMKYENVMLQLKNRVVEQKLKIADQDVVRLRSDAGFVEAETKTGSE